MRAIIRRLRRIEVLGERRRRRAEASGEPFDEPLPHTGTATTGRIPNGCGDAPGTPLGTRTRDCKIEGDIDDAQRGRLLASIQIPNDRETLRGDAMVSCR
jgi:hypothetical protein